MPAYASRRNRLRKLIHQAAADALLVTNFKNVTYLTGFTGDDSFLLVTERGETLITDRRYTTQLEVECPGLKLEVRGPGERMLPVAVGVIERARLKRLGIEAESATVSLERTLAKDLPKHELVPTDSLVERLRIVKDKDEIDETRQACRQAERAYEVVKALLTPDMTELEVAAELEYQARRFGAKALSFAAIVAVGPRAALPHATPTAAKLKSSDFLLIDWGATQAST